MPFHYKYCQPLRGSFTKHVFLSTKPHSATFAVCLHAVTFGETPRHGALSTTKVCKYDPGRVSAAQTQTYSYSFRICPGGISAGTISLCQQVNFSVADSSRVQIIAGMYEHRVPDNASLRRRILRQTRPFATQRLHRAENTAFAHRKTCSKPYHPGVRQYFKPEAHCAKRPPCTANVSPIQLPC